MKRPVTSSIPDQPVSTKTIPVQQVVKIDVTGTENPEKTLVVETPAGERNETGQVDTLQDDIDAVEPLQTVMDKDDTLNDTVPSTSNTPDMPNGMANVQQLRDGTFVVRAKWYHYARIETIGYIHIIP